MISLIIGDWGGFGMKYRNGMVGAVLAALLIPAAAPAAPVPDVAAPVIRFLDSFNKGDTKAALATMASGPVAIIDEFAPHAWIGPTAAADWMAEYDRHAKATGVTGGIVSHGKPSRIVVAGTVAYVVLPTLYTYKENGKPTAEEGQMTAALKQTPAGWKITAWTWTGVIPHPAR